MIITLGGRFENALFREVSAQGDRTAIEIPHSYYASLYRHTDRSYFERSATLISVADNTLLPSVDWSVTQGGVDRGFAAEDLGLKNTFAGGNEWDHDTEVLASLALLGKAFSQESLHSLCSVNGPSRRIPSPPPRTIEGVGSVDAFALHHLCRLLLQIRAARELRSSLVIGPEERTIIGELCEYIIKSRIALPYDLPDLRSCNVIDAENFAGGLFNFSPPDALAAVRVRNDPEIKRYATKVKDILGRSSTIDTQRELIHAMREAYRTTEAARKAEKIFEVVSWVAKPLHYIPGVGEGLSLAEDTLELLKKWIERKQGNEDWFLLGARMTDIGIKDYLKRTGNM